MADVALRSIAELTPEVVVDCTADTPVIDPAGVGVGIEVELPLLKVSEELVIVRLPGAVGLVTPTSVIR